MIDKNNLELLTNIKIKIIKKYIKKSENKECLDSQIYLDVYKISSCISKYFFKDNSFIIPSLKSLNSIKKKLQNDYKNYENLLKFYNSIDYKNKKEEINNKLQKIEDDIESSLSPCHKYTLDYIISEQFVGFGTEEKKRKEYETRKALVNLYSVIKNDSKFLKNHELMLSILEDNKNILTLMSIEINLKEKTLLFLQNKLKQIKKKINEINYLIVLFESIQENKNIDDKLIIRLNNKICVTIK